MRDAQIDGVAQVVNRVGLSQKGTSRAVGMTTAALKALGFSRGEIQRVRNYAKGAGISVPEMVRCCVEEMAWQVALISPRPNS